MNGKVYIGQTIRTINCRWQQHIHAAKSRNARDHNTKLHNAINKYGADAFTVDIIEEVDNAIIDDREKYWIQYYDSIHSGYNITIGGEGMTKYTDDFIRACWDSGLKVVDVCKKYNMSTTTYCSRLRNIGVSDEEIAQRKLQHLIETNGTPVHQYSLDGKYIRSFPSMNQAARETGIGHINDAASGERYAAGGYLWSTKKAENIGRCDSRSLSILKPVLQFTTSWQFIKEYKSAKAAETALGISNVGRACKKGQNAGGYKWTYKDVAGDKETV